MENKRKKRFFIAFNLPGNAKEKVKNIIDKFSTINRGVKWIDPEGAHLTLYFLGELDRQEEDRVKIILKNNKAKTGKIDFNVSL